MDDSNMEWVRQHYLVPAREGRMVEIYRIRGTRLGPDWQLIAKGPITGATNYIHVGGWSYHPTHNVVYYDDDGSVLLDTRQPDVKGIRVFHPLSVDRRVGQLLKEYEEGRRDFDGLDLRYARLSGQDLSGISLRGAKLEHSILVHTIFKDADLTDTCLDPNAPVPSLTDAEILEAGFELSLHGELEAGSELGEWVYGWRTEWSHHVGHMHYVPRLEPYTAPVFSVDLASPCHPGIYLSSYAKVKEEYGEHTSVVPCHCRRDELVHAGYEWRTKRLWVDTDIVYRSIPAE